MMLQRYFIKKIYKLNYLQKIYKLNLKYIANKM